MHANYKPGMPDTDSEDPHADRARQHKPADAEPVQDEEMFVDPLTVLTNAGDEGKNPPSGA